MKLILFNIFSLIVVVVKSTCPPKFTQWYTTPTETICGYTRVSSGSDFLYGDALQTCNSVGAYLPSVHSDKENQDLRDAVKASIGQQAKEEQYWFWIGLQCTSLLQYYWADGTVVDYESLFCNPASWNPAFHFVMMGDAYFINHRWGCYDKSTRWHTIACTKRIPSSTRPVTSPTPAPVTTYEPTTSPRPTTKTLSTSPATTKLMTTTRTTTQLPTTTTRDQSCRNFGIVLPGDSKCMKLFTNAASWTDAEATCDSLGGHLFSLHSNKDNDFIRRTAVANGLLNGIHIGLFNTNGGELSWVWSDRSTLDYINFEQGSPDPDEGECTIMTTRGLWRTARCTQILPFICEWML